MLLDPGMTNISANATLPCLSHLLGYTGFNIYLSGLINLLKWMVLKIVLNLILYLDVRIWYLGHLCGLLSFTNLPLLLTQSQHK